MKISSSRVPLFFSGFVAMFSLPWAGSAYDLSPGNYFPEMALPSVRDGRPVSLPQYRGKKLMLHLFASW